MKKEARTIGGQMQIGQLDKRCTIQAYSTTQNEYGEDVPSWSDEATVFCAVEFPEVGSTERIEGQQITAAQLVYFTIRHYPAGVDASKRISYGGSIHDIIAVGEVGRSSFLTIKTRRNDANGN